MWPSPTNVYVDEPVSPRNVDAPVASNAAGVTAPKVEAAPRSTGSTWTNAAASTVRFWVAVPVLPAGSATVATTTRTPGARSADGVTIHDWLGWTTAVNGCAPSMLTLTTAPAETLLIPTIVGVVSFVVTAAPPSIVMAGPTRSMIKSCLITVSIPPAVAVTTTGTVPLPNVDVVVADQIVSSSVTSKVRESTMTAIVEPDSTVPVITGEEFFVRLLLVMAKITFTFKTWVAVVTLPAESVALATIVHSPPVMPFGVMFHVPDAAPS